MNKILNKEWIKAALIRAIKTVAQTALSMISIGMAISDINWLQVLSVSAVAGLFSILTSIAGLPEIETDGVLNMSEGKFNIKLDSVYDWDDVNKKNKLTLRIDK